MEEANKSAALADKLAGPIRNVIDKHRADITLLMAGSHGQAAQSALRNDESVRKVATFCYPLLPGLVRLAVKEHVFVNFVLDHREKLLAPLTAPDDATAPVNATAAELPLNNYSTTQLLRRHRDGLGRLDHALSTADAVPVIAAQAPEHG